MRIRAGSNNWNNAISSRRSKWRNVMRRSGRKPSLSRPDRSLSRPERSNNTSYRPSGSDTSCSRSSMCKPNLTASLSGQIEGVSLRKRLLTSTNPLDCAVEGIYTSTMMVAITRIAVWLLLLTIVPAAGAQEKSTPQTSSPQHADEYKPGQMWSTDLGATITVLAVEELHKLGKVVHVRVDRIPLSSCGEVHLTTAIPHIALNEKTMRKSAQNLLKDNVDLPDSYFDEYRKWEANKKHEVLKAPLRQEIYKASLSGAGVMICNFLPSKT